jgi:hypothetical protein
MCVGCFGFVCACPRTSHFQSCGAPCSLHGLSTAEELSRVETAKEIDEVKEFAQASAGVGEGVGRCASGASV